MPNVAARERARGRASGDIDEKKPLARANAVERAFDRLTERVTR